ncbi:hypothetical protein [Paenibacillus sp. J2TS4]|uniref:hypothetical protein n=1 Tax=Paenibacillus sp. J2TS4 TaxID=2807194 RepID=UPI001B123961|nr:hypothetical protein [Paenibacillus sp. J2TS4]GIP35338.1 hypothetical protein J2TS4_45480 [Paenibacillus sp. J2TS4]
MGMREQQRDYSLEGMNSAEELSAAVPLPCHWQSTACPLPRHWQVTAGPLPCHISRGFDSLYIICELTERFKRTFYIFVPMLV